MDSTALRKLVKGALATGSLCVRPMSFTLPPRPSCRSCFSSLTLPRSPSTSSRCHASQPWTGAHAAFTTTARVLSLTQSSQIVRDEEITARKVRVVDPETNKLLPPRPTSKVLASIDRSRHWLIQVALADPDAPPGSPEAAPICKLLDKKTEYEKQKAAKAKEKEKRRAAAAGQGRHGEPEEKELQLTWGVSAHDLGHKLSKARKDFIKAGPMIRVTIHINAKKRSKPADAKMAEERWAMIRQIEQMLADVAKPWKESELQKRNSAGVIKLQGLQNTKKATEEGEMTAAEDGSKAD